jgi:phosphotransferase system enzyme I (PtsP)
MQETSLLLTLEEISQLISHSHDSQQTLSNIVQLLQRRFGTEVCSVYLLEPRSRELVLANTVGLDQKAIGRIRMRMDEGLTGLTAEQASPVVVKEAFAHPRFKYFPDAGEDEYHSFLGVPLLDAGQVTGVLVLQTVQPRDYTADEVRMLITAASQLSPLVSDAWLLQQVESTSDSESASAETPVDRPLNGTSLSAGIGAGAAYWARTFDWHLLASEAGDRDHESRRLAEAIELAKQETERLSHRIASLVGEDQGTVMQAQLLILQDSKIQTDLDHFLSEGVSAESAVLHTAEKYTRLFEQISNEYFRDRLYDIKDVFRRILWHLRPGTHADQAGEERVVLVGEEALVSDLFSVDVERLAAIVVERGGKHSHAAILARTLKIPMVAQVTNLAVSVRSGARLLVDGNRSLVFVEPSDSLLSEAVARQAEIDARPQEFRPAAPAGSSQPTDRKLPIVQANVNLLAEARLAVERGAAGVGLYRTEFLILSRRNMISEEQQVRNYQQFLGMLEGRAASIRTFDLRAEKALPRSGNKSDSGSLDWRLLLRSPAVQRVFRQQVRAILRAGVVGPVRILVPLIISGAQLQWVKQAIREACDELDSQGLPFAANVPVGIMIEVPLAAAMVDEWADQVDYLCIGTNDLLASAMGVTRDDPVSEIVCDLMHPGLLRTVEHVISAGHRAGKSVTVCGELAADEQGSRMLAQMGADSLSVAVDQISRVRANLESLAIV